MLKRFIRKALLGYKASSEDYLNYLRNKGAKIGRGGGIPLLSKPHLY